ncbi:MAG: arginine--tRNA ligase, partial [Candidatus Moranbacteria bacterium]|nr:arginine--tRNA ligase [Candidatus Moranbacteria bacterium]
EGGLTPKTPKSARKIVLEHTNANPNKALHIGHLRSACLGNACEKILEFLGNNVETQYYVDDTGVQVATFYLGISELGVGQKENEKYDHYAGRAYVKAAQAIEKDKKILKIREKILKTLDNQEDKKIADEIITKVEKVLKANLETVGEFGIDYDLLVWESEIIKNKLWEKTRDILSGLPVYYKANSGKNKGCWVIKTSDGKEKVLIKSDQTITYTGKDIAYHLWKYAKLSEGFKYAKYPVSTQKKDLWTTCEHGKKNDIFGKADRVVNFIDARQSHLQKVIRECLKSMNFSKEAESFHHVGYGVVSLSSKTARELGLEDDKEKNQYAMSGRRGLIVLVDDLLNLLEKKIRQKHAESPYPRKIAASALKYYLLKHNTFSDIVFDYEQALDIYGNSGPYLQYTCARMKSVLKKAKSPNFSRKDFTGITLCPEETAVIRWLIHFSEIIKEAGGQFAPNLLSNYLFDLAKRFNSFYNRKPILKSREGKMTSRFRVFLTKITLETLSRGLNLIGIEVLDKM